MAGRLLGERRRGRLAIRDELAAAGPGAARSEVAREGGRVVVRPPPPLGAHAAARPHGPSPFGLTPPGSLPSSPVGQRRLLAAAASSPSMVTLGSPVAAEAAARLRERFVCVDVAMRGASVLVSVTRRARAAVPDRERHKPLAHAPPAGDAAAPPHARGARACPTSGTRRRASGCSEVTTRDADAGQSSPSEGGAQPLCGGGVGRGGRALCRRRRRRRARRRCGCR